MGLLPEFDVKITTKEQDKAALSKLAGTKSRAKTTPNTLLDKLEMIRIEVMAHLGKFKGCTDIIRSSQALEEYIDLAIANGELAIDTETTGLDPILDKIVGVCLYTPGKSRAYIPINHVSYVDGARVPNQLSEQEVAVHLQRLGDTKLIYHNAKFDIRFIRNQLHTSLSAYWDTMLASRILNENERAGLKFQYADKIEKQSKQYDFDSLFKGICINIVPIEVAALYAATDPYDTYELCKYQQNILFKPENSRLLDVLMNIEMPVLPVVCDMEDYGIELDTSLAQQYSTKYHAKLDEVEQRLQKELASYDQQITQYKVMHPNHKLSTPISLNSPTQLAIFLYDILKVAQIDGRGTGEEILKQLNLPICNTILDYREVKKILTTYVDKLPEVVNPKTKRIHASFNQFGADTGRMSSSDPNLQNIPSKNQEIRRMFKATDGYVLVGNDFSQQEPRHLANFSKDQNMIDAYAHNLDFYATVASKVYHMPYEECLEFRPDGTVNKEGKKRRTNCKSVLLGLMYGRGPASIAQQLHCTADEARGIISDFYTAYPKVKQWMDDTVVKAKQTGYAETLWGRRRHLPDIQMPMFEIDCSEAAPEDFNPLFGFGKSTSSSTDGVRKKYEKMLTAARGYREVNQIKEQAAKEKVKIKDNGGFISAAERQAVNSRIQGSAADQSKRAMIAVRNNKRLQELDFHLMLAVHDELIGECPIENAVEVGEIFSDLMRHSAEPECEVAMKSDSEYSLQWYGTSIDYLDEFIRDYTSNTLQDIQQYHKTV